MHEEGGGYWVLGPASSRTCSPVPSTSSHPPATSTTTMTIEAATRWCSVVLIDNVPRLEVEGHPVLLPLRCDALERWIVFCLDGSACDDDETTLVVTKHNAYVSSFANRSLD